MAEAARFWAIDLHVHTPASRDVSERQYGEASPEAVVRAALAAVARRAAELPHAQADDEGSESPADFGSNRWKHASGVALHPLDGRGP